MTKGTNMLYAVVAVDDYSCSVGHKDILNHLLNEQEQGCYED